MLGMFFETQCKCVRVKIAVQRDWISRHYHRTALRLITGDQPSLAYEDTKHYTLLPLSVCLSTHTLYTASGHGYAGTGPPRTVLNFEDSSGTKNRGLGLGLNTLASSHL